MRVRGVDARGRSPFWIAQIEDGAVETIEACEALDEALAAPDAEAIAVDVALGHEDPSGETEGLRACDRAARELLGDASDRVFVLPPPAVFDADTYHDALEACREHGWPDLEAPLWFARERLQAIHRLAGEDARLHEVHPEVSFAHMAQGEPQPADHYGDTWAALHERLKLLHGQGLHPGPPGGGRRARSPPRAGRLRGRVERRPHRPAPSPKPPRRSAHRPPHQPTRGHPRLRQP